MVLIFNQRLAVFSIGLLLTLVVICELPINGQAIAVPQAEAITGKQGLPQAFVSGIVQDHQGFVWMTTRDGLCRYDGKHFKVFQPTSDGTPSISSSSLMGLDLDRRGRMWIFSDYNDIDILDPFREQFVNFSRQPFFKKQFGQDVIYKHYSDRQGRLWLLFVPNKIACINPVTHHVRLYKLPLPNNKSYPEFCSFVQDKLGTLWLSGKHGLYRFDTAMDSFLPFTLPENDLRGIGLRFTGELFILSRRSVLILNPKSGHIRTFPLPASSSAALIWNQTSIVSDSEGNEYFNYYNVLYRFSETTGITILTKLAKGQDFRTLLVDKSDVLWAGTNKIGVFKYNLKTNAFKTIPYKSGFYTDLLEQELNIPSTQIPDLGQQISPYNFRYTFDKAQKMWFNLADNHFFQIDLVTKKVTPVASPFPPSLAMRHFKDNPIVSMATDPAGHVWVVSDSLAMWYENGQWRSFPHSFRTNYTSNNQRLPTDSPKRIEGKVIQAVVDMQALWLATDTQGLYRVDRINGQISAYQQQPRNPTSLSSNQLFCLFDDPLDQTILWVGTFASGLCRFDKRTGSCRRFSTKTGLPDNVIYSAIPDQLGYLWIGTNQGLCRMDRRSFQVNTYTQEDGLLENEFNHFHFLHLPNNRIIMGGLEGIVSFFPSN